MKCVCKNLALLFEPQCCYDDVRFVSERERPESKALVTCLTIIEFYLEFLSAALRALMNVFVCSCHVPLCVCLSA